MFHHMFTAGTPQTAAYIGRMRESSNFLKNKNTLSISVRLKKPLIPFFLSYQ